MAIPCQALKKGRCIDYPVREYMTGETPAWKRRAYYIVRVKKNREKEDYAKTL